MRMLYPITLLCKYFILYRNEDLDFQKRPFYRYQLYYSKFRFQNWAKYLMQAFFWGRFTHEFGVFNSPVLLYVLRWFEVKSNVFLSYLPFPRIIPRLELWLWRFKYPFPHFFVSLTPISRSVRSAPTPDLDTPFPPFFYRAFWYGLQWKCPPPPPPARFSLATRRVPSQSLTLTTSLVTKQRSH